MNSLATRAASSISGCAVKTRCLRERDTEAMSETQQRARQAGVGLTSDLNLSLLLAGAVSRATRVSLSHKSLARGCRRTASPRHVDHMRAALHLCKPASDRTKPSSLLNGLLHRQLADSTSRSAAGDLGRRRRPAGEPPLSPEI